MTLSDLHEPPLEFYTVDEIERLLLELPPADRNAASRGLVCLWCGCAGQPLVQVGLYGGERVYVHQGGSQECATHEAAAARARAREAQDRLRRRPWPEAFARAMLCFIVGFVPALGMTVAALKAGGTIPLLVVGVVVAALYVIAGRRSASSSEAVSLSAGCGWLAAVAFFGGHLTTARTVMATLVVVFFVLFAIGFGTLTCAEGDTNDTEDH